MKKWMNSIFFGSSFIAAMLIEALSIQVLKDNLFITSGLGIVVLITGYLFMDSIRNFLIQSRDDAKFYMDRVLSEETEKWSERYNELVNLQKASYTATKKNNALITGQFDEILSRLETLENNNAMAWQKITELQKKALEGQKNALNLEINYNKENTKRVIGLLREDENDISGQLTKILSLFEESNKLLLSRIDLSEQAGKPEDILTKDLYQDLDMADHIEEELPEDENTSETGWFTESEPETEAADTSAEADISDETGTPAEVDISDETDTSAETDISDETDTPAEADILQEAPAVKPIYDDPNKSLTADEIAALFASFGK